MVTSDPYGISRAVRPWAGPGPSDSLGAGERVHTCCDSQEKIDYCLNCTRPASSCDTCRGLGAKGDERAARRERIHALLRAGHSDREIAEAAGVTAASVSYHRRKLGIPEPLKEDPCLRCRTRSICEAMGGTCNEKARWRG